MNNPFFSVGALINGEVVINRHTYYKFKIPRRLKIEKQNCTSVVAVNSNSFDFYTLCRLQWEAKWYRTNWRCSTGRNINGNNTGKFSTQLVNGATINYDRILSEAQQELQEQREELLETYREPLGIYVV